MKNDRYGRKVETVSEYIQGFPKDVQTRLRALRSLIKKVAPKAEETINYNIPAYRFGTKLSGRLVYFAAFEKRIGMYPASAGSAEVQKLLSKYRVGKGTFQFPHDEPLPLPLIRKFVASRLKLVDQKSETG
ncbi:DUF1801 domain-containing protein [Patescibacteria group bacterium]|nr:DUF1801 domain-containing protein [Patescibacteria group bacterium]